MRRLGGGHWKGTEGTPLSVLFQLDDCDRPTVWTNARFGTRSMAEWRKQPSVAFEFSLDDHNRLTRQFDALIGTLIGTLPLSGGRGVL